MGWHLFYYTGILTWVFIACAIFIYISAYYVDFWINHIIPSYLNLKFYLFGNKKWKGKYYKFWVEHCSSRFDIQEHWHSLKHFKRLAYKRFISEILKERREKMISNDIAHV